MIPRGRVVGVGVDVVSVARLARARARRPTLIELICAPEECAAAADDRRAAELWAGKEAIAKTLGTGFWQEGVGWPDVRILPDGRVRLCGRAARLAGDTVVTLATARDGDHLVAVALRWAGRR